MSDPPREVNTTDTTRFGTKGDWQGCLHSCLQCAPTTADRITHRHRQETPRGSSHASSSPNCCNISDHKQSSARFDHSEESGQRIPGTRGYAGLTQFFNLPERRLLYPTSHHSQSEVRRALHQRLTAARIWRI